MISARGRFLVIEGSDATGKSTLGARLGAEERAGRVECPPPPLSGIKGEALKSLDPFSRLLYFASGNVQLGALARATPPGRSLVGVRYIWSTLAYHSAIERITVAESLAMIQSVIPRLELPDHVVFLTVDESVQHERLTERGELIGRAPRELIEFDERVTGSFLDAFELLPARVTVKDTTSTPVDELVSDLRPLLRGAAEAAAAGQDAGAQ